jgi:glyoxylase-like metal-dependent hydrolase (beta-lactamase superfamily II)/rhodanese-related sulfurtransferase
MFKKYITATVLLGSVFFTYATADVKELLQSAQKTVKSIDTKELVNLLKKDPNTLIIDLRTKSDILNQGGYIKANRVRNIPRDKMEFMITEEVFKKDTPFIVHCYTGNISLLGAKQLQAMGYINVIHYKDSYKGWSEAGLKTSSLDRYRESMLYRKPEKVAQGVYASIGQTSPGSYENSNHNNNLGFVIGDDSVLVWNAAGSYLLAKALHEEIKKITDKPIKYVVLENSQSHAMLGGAYWKEQGATIVAHEIAKEEMIEKGESILQKKAKSLKDKMLGSKIVLPDITFNKNYTMDLGNRIVEAKYFGYAHEHSDIAIWLPKEKILFAGDLAFNQRLLPIFEITETNKWLEAWEGVEKLQAKIVIPGHGDTTDMATVRRYTKDYLVYLREKIFEVIDNDGGLNEAYKIDMSAYEHLDTYRELGKQNITRAFMQLEFE